MKKVNYIKELNAFREWLLMNDLPAGAISLWYTLMSINNLARWKKRFNAPNAVVRQLTGLSKQGVIDARNILIEHELIQCIQGKRGQAPIYEMNSLVEKNAQLVDESVDHLLDPTDAKSFSTTVNSSATVDRTLDPSLDSATTHSLSIRKHKQNETETKQKNNPLLFKKFSPSKSIFDELRKEASS